MTGAAWWQKPRLTAAGRESVVTLRESFGENPLCVAGQDTLAAWLWLLVRTGELSARDVERAMARGSGWGGLLSLAQRGGERLVDRMAGCAVRAVPADIARVSHGWCVDLYVPLDGDRPQIQLIGSALLDVQIDFNAMPPELASAVFDTFRLIAAMVPVGFGKELFDGGAWAWERLCDYEQLQKLGVLDDPAAALAAVNSNECMVLEASSAEEMQEILGDAHYWLDSASFWPNSTVKGAPNERAETLLARTAEWRSAPEWGAWVQFIEAVTQYVRARSYLPEWFQQRSAVLELDDMQRDLSLTCHLLSGNPIESQLLHGERDMLCEMGEEAVASIALDDTHREDAWTILQDLSVATGWLLWAEAIANDNRE